MFVLCVLLHQSVLDFAYQLIFLIKNNLEIDVKSKCVEEGITQAQLAGKVGTTAPYVNRIIKKPEGVVNKTFMSMMEQLGYDIEMVYVKKKKYE